MTSAPPSLSGIYLRAAIGLLTKQKRLSPSVTTLPALPKEQFDFKIDSGHVDAFRQCLKSPPSDHIPAGYLQCYLASLPMNTMTLKEFPVNVVGSIHEKTSMKSFRHVNAGETLRAKGTVNEKIELSEKNDWIITTVTEVESVSESDEIMRMENQWRILNPDRNKIKVERTPKEPVDYSTWTESAVWNFAADTGRAYAAVNGDYNPIHLYPITAKVFGYKTSIAHGLFTISKIIGEPGLNSYADTGKFEINAGFSRPTFIPNDVTLYTKDADEGKEFAAGIYVKDEFKETVQGKLL